MIDPQLQELHEAQEAARMVFDDIAKSLDPDTKKSDITITSDTITAFLKSHYRAGDNEIEMLRNDRKFRERWYTLENGELAGKALDMRHKMMDMENSVLALTAAIETYYATTNQPVPDTFKTKSTEAVASSKKRISAFVVDLDEVLDEAEEDMREQLEAEEKKREILKEKHLQNCRAGFDAATTYDHTLDMLAGRYLMVADAYYLSAGLNAAIQVLDLESEPKSFGGPDHRLHYKAMQNDMKHAATAISFARQASPQNVPGAQNKAATTVAAPINRMN